MAEKGKTTTRKKKKRKKKPNQQRAENLKQSADGGGLWLERRAPLMPAEAVALEEFDQKAARQPGKKGRKRTFQLLPHQRRLCAEWQRTAGHGAGTGSGGRAGRPPCSDNSISLAGADQKTERGSGRPRTAPLSLAATEGERDGSARGSRVGLTRAGVNKRNEEE